MIRPAVASDAAAVAAIYAPAVLHGTATFEIEPPDAAEMAARMAKVARQGNLWLVFEDDRGVAGYAYAAQFRDRPAYSRTCECSIYVAPGRHRAGIGRQLLAALAESAREKGFREMIAVIGDSDNIASISLHRAAGFVEAGWLRNVGFKFERWLDVVYMQRSL